MRRPQVSREEQLRLIQECRASGMSDNQWCLQHGIQPGTFYNWVSRNKKRGDVHIPEPGGAAEYWPEANPDIVRIDLKRDQSPITIQSAVQPAAVAVPENRISAALPTASVMELELNGTRLKISNDVDPGLLIQVLAFLRGGVC